MASIRNENVEHLTSLTGETFHRRIDYDFYKILNCMQIIFGECRRRKGGYHSKFYKLYSADLFLSRIAAFRGIIVQNVRSGKQFFVSYHRI